MNETLTISAVTHSRHAAVQAKGTYIDLAAPTNVKSLITPRLKSSNSIPLHSTSAKTVARFGGSSSATAVVSGVAALLLAKCPNLTRQQLYQVLMDSVDRSSDFQVQYVGRGVINAEKAWSSLDQCQKILPSRQ